MIISMLSGGLGNQLFQYAAARALAERNKSELYFDLRLLKDESTAFTKRNFELSCFNIPGKLADEKLIKKLEKKISVSKKISKIIPASLAVKYAEPHFEFDPLFFEIQPPAIISGHFQSEKYFEPVKDIIKKELSPGFEMSQPGTNLLRHITSVNSVSIHIRRGDYVNDETTRNFHGTCSISYYESAIHTIVAKKKALHLFIFSDDIDWALKNFKPNHPATFVVHSNLISTAEELHLMSKCRHNIIANSSFSWWAAWLNCNPEKIIVAPEKWFNKPGINTKDLIPAGWIKM